MSYWVYLSLFVGSTWGFFCFCCREAYKQTKAKRKQLQEAYAACRDKKLDLQGLRENPNHEALVVFEKVLPQYHQNPINFRKRQEYKNIIDNKKPFLTTHGGCFNFQVGQQPILCDVQHCEISSSLLKEQRKDVSIFGQCAPYYESIQYSLQPASILSVIGTLCYDIQLGKFVIKSHFICQSANEILEKYKGQQYAEKCAYIFCGVGVCLALIHPLRLITRYLTKRKQPENQKQEVHQNSSYIKQLRVSADPVDQLNCRQCRQNSAEIIFECGHLVQCIKCHQRDLQSNKSDIFVAKCALCTKLSRKFTKIYLA